MIAALALTAALGLHFEPQDFQGLWVRTGGGTVAIGAMFGAFHADVNGDGEMDLVFDRSVVFQEEGRFSEKDRVYFTDRVPELAKYAPEEGADPFNGPFWDIATDAFEGDVYLWQKGRIWVLHWQGAEDAPWQVTAFDVAGDEGFEHWRAGAGELLQDIDGDGEPEIVWAAEESIYIVRKDASGVYQVGLPIRPPLPASLWEGRAALWPPIERKIDDIGAWREGQIAVYNGEAILQWQSRAVAGKLTWHWRQISLSGGEDGPNHSVVTPDYVRPIHLNGNGRLDFAGGWAEPPKAGKIQRPVYETLASLDEGKTYTRVRSRCVEPFVNFADINRDGRYDLVTEDVELFSLGPREMALRLAADQSTPITVSVRLQREDERGFETDPIQGRFTVAKPLADPEAMLSGRSMWRVDIAGDLDGDGWNDAVVRTAPDQLTVYKGGPTGWAKEPMGGLPIERDQRWSLYDVNADGRGDIVLSQHSEEGKGLPSSLIYLSRPGDPRPNKGVIMETKP